MPYKSLKQERFFNANKAELEKKGVDVNEWNAASKGKKLPTRFPGRGTKSKLNAAAEKMFFRSNSR